jgi:hypothetical protein
MIYLVCILLILNLGLTLMLTVSFKNINIALQFIISKLEEGDQP